MKNTEKEISKSKSNFNRYFTYLILLHIMFHAPMGRFQLELIYYFTYFSTVIPSNICVFHSCRPFVVNTTFSTPTIPVENFVITKGLQEKNTHVGWDDGGKIGKNNKLI